MPLSGVSRLYLPPHLHLPGLSALIWATGLVARNWGINVGHLLRTGADGGVEGGRVGVQAQPQQRGEQERQDEGGSGNAGQVL